METLTTPTVTRYGPRAPRVRTEAVLVAHFVLCVLTLRLARPAFVLNDASRVSWPALCAISAMVTGAAVAMGRLSTTPMEAMRGCWELYVASVR